MSSDLSGRVSSDSIASSTLIFSASTAATAAEIGMSTFFCARHFQQHRRGERAFGELAVRGVRRLLAFAERDAEGEIARLRASSR